MTEIQTEVDQNPEILIGIEAKSRSDQQVQCWNYGKTGHFRNQCKSPKKKNGDDSANRSEERRVGKECLE